MAKKQRPREEIDEALILLNLIGGVDAPPTLVAEARRPQLHRLKPRHRRGMRQMRLPKKSRKAKTSQKPLPASIGRLYFQDAGNMMPVLPADWIVKYGVSCHLWYNFSAEKI